MLRHRVGITLDQEMVGPEKIVEFSAQEAIWKTLAMQVMLAPGVCGKLGNPSIYPRRERNGEVG